MATERNGVFKKPLVGLACLLNDKRREPDMSIVIWESGVFRKVRV